MLPGDEKIQKLKEIAKRLRRHVISMIAEAGSGHPGGSLSAVEIVTTLYFHQLRHDPKNPDWPDRDRFILSKGHACALLYAALAEAGYYPVEELKTFRKLGSPFQGHPCRLKTVGVEIPTGSLGQGLSAGIGIALAGKLDKRDYRVYVLLGDGECQEGQIWEGAMAASHYKLDNLCVLLDHNRLQIDGRVPDIMRVEPLGKKWKAFRWHSMTINGHDFKDLLEAFEEAQNTKGMPTIIVCNTVKGKGVSFMEREVDWHGKAPDPKLVQKALQEIEGS
jgi:transketolase